MREEHQIPGTDLVEHFSVVVRRFDQCWDVPERSAPFSYPPTVSALVKKNYEAVKSKIERGVSEFDDKHNGQIAVICGSGPSLARDIEAIKGLPRDNIKVIAINSAIRPIFDRVDYYFLIDWMAKREWWQGLDLSNMPCVLAMACPPYTVDDMPNRFYFTGSLGASMGIEEDKKYQKFGYLESGFVASYSAMHMAYRMGFKRIVFVGHDSAYTNLCYDYTGFKVGMKMIGEATVKNKTRLSVDYLGTTMCEDMRGNPTLSDSRMRRGMHMLNAGSILLDEIGIPVINASEEGIWSAERRAKLLDCIGPEAPRPLIPAAPMKVKYIVGQGVIEEAAA